MKNKEDDQILATARAAIDVLLTASRENRLNRMADPDFAEGWKQIFVAGPQLHPDDFNPEESEMAFDNGAHALFTDIANPYFVESGWPVAFKPIAVEAKRRYDAEQLTDEQYYPTPWVEIMETR